MKFGLVYLKRSYTLKNPEIWSTMSRFNDDTIAKYYLLTKRDRKPEKYFIREMKNVIASKL